MSDSPHDIWKVALGEIELSLSQANFTTWFSNTSLHSISDGTATIRVPNGFTKEWLNDKYHKIILRALRNISPTIRDIQYTITPASEQTSPHRRAGLPTSPGVSQALPFQSNSPSSYNLNPRYTFDSFVVASSNELAHAAALAVVKKPGDDYNPLFIYGGVGLGKTHLLQATGNATLKQSPDASVLYTSSDSFTEEVVMSVQHNRMDQFKEKYRRVDVLIIDDIQFLAGREKTQHEFFQVFNKLFQHNKQIILSSDRPPKALATIENRLRSRFEGGMIADINPPDLETRVAILRKKLEERETTVEMHATVLEQIASVVKRNVRELEGVLTHVLGQAELQGQTPSAEDVRSILKNIAAVPSASRVTPDRILETVSQFYNVSIEELYNRSRRKDVVKPRQVAMYLLRTELDTSFPAIGERLGNRDHTTAMYAYNKINDLKEDDETFFQELEALETHLHTEQA